MKVKVIAGTITFYVSNEVLRETKYDSKSDRERHINSFVKMAESYIESNHRFWYKISPKTIVVILSDLIPEEMPVKFERVKGEYSNKSYI